MNQIGSAGIGMVIGVAFGIIIGSLYNQVGLGIALGAAFGLIFGCAIPFREKEKPGDAP